jgi:hypothetical protein
MLFSFISKRSILSYHKKKVFILPLYAPFFCLACYIFNWSSETKHLMNYIRERKAEDELSKTKKIILSSNVTGYSIHSWPIRLPKVVVFRGHVGFYPVEFWLHNRLPFQIIFYFYFFSALWKVPRYFLSSPLQFTQITATNTQRRLLFFLYLTLIPKDRYTQELTMLSLSIFLFKLLNQLTYTYFHEN